MLHHAERKWFWIDRNRQQQVGELPMIRLGPDNRVGHKGCFFGKRAPTHDDPSHMMGTNSSCFLIFLMGRFYELLQHEMCKVNRFFQLQLRTLLDCNRVAGCWGIIGSIQLGPISMRICCSIPNFSLGFYIDTPCFLLGFLRYGRTRTLESIGDLHQPLVEENSNGPLSMLPLPANDDSHSITQRIARNLHSLGVYSPQAIGVKLRIPLFDPICALLSFYFPQTWSHDRTLAPGNRRFFLVHDGENSI